MKTTILPYLFFDGCCEEAIDFYCQNLGAKVEMMMRFSECPDPLPPEMNAEKIGDKIMHATFHIAGNTLMASDSCCGGEAAPEFAGFALSLQLPNETETKRIFDHLAAEGKVEMPLEKTFWSPCFGMVQDRFKMKWMLTVEPTQ